MTLPSPQEPYITGFTVEGYKAFARRSSIELGRLTLLLGRNNAGKTALCLAPLFFVHPLEEDADAPFATSYRGVDFGTLQSVCFRRQPTGLVGALDITGSQELQRVTVGATFLPEQGYAQFVTKLDLQKSDNTHITRVNVPWPEARSQLSTFHSLRGIPRSVHVLRGVRPIAPRYHPYLGHVPEAVGAHGEEAPMILAASGDKGFDEINRWFKPMRVQLRAEQRGDAFELLAAGTSGEAVNLVDSGAGVAQVLPLVVALLLARARPSLLCIEQPELHLHPRAHTSIADLILEGLSRLPGSRFLIETHSDTLVLRIRREVAARRLSPAEVRIYFVDEDSPEGSIVREIELDERGTPRWWPKDVFAESRNEYFAIRRELARHEGKA